MNRIIQSKTKEYIRPVPANWWTQRPGYIRFILREFTGLFLAGYAVFLLALVRRSEDPAAFQSLLTLLKSPVSIALQMIVLFFALFHSVTFFGLTPRVIRINRGEERVPDGAIAGAHYLFWLVVTLIILFLAVRSSS